MPNPREEIRQGDEVPLQVNFKDDGVTHPITDATLMEIWVEKPDGTPAKYTANFLTDGSDGSIVYNLPGTETTQEGQHTVQGHVEGPGYKMTSKKQEFYVGEVIDVSGL